MNIVFTCNRVGSGGAERVITNIANRMAQDGINVEIICYDILDDFYYKVNEGVSIIEIDKNLKNYKSFFERKLFGVRNLYRLYATLKKISPDLVVSFYTKQNCYSILCSKLLKIPIIAAERDHFFIADSKMNHILRKIFYHRADGFIHQTKWAKKYLEEHYHTPLNAIILHNPIWITQYGDRNPEHNVVIAVGRLAEQKNYNGMIQAFRIVANSVPDVKLKIYGSGPQDRLNELIYHNNLDKNVILMGQTQDVVSCYLKADAFVMFSHGEGYPNALMEALACGVPCVSSDCPIGGPSELLEDGINGYLTVNEDINDFANKIIALLESQETKERFSNNAMKIRESNSMDTIYEQLMKYIRTFVNKRNLNEKYNQVI